MAAARSRRRTGAHHSATVDQRVRDAVDRMLDGSWVLGRSTLEHRARYGLGSAQADNDVRTASRFIRMSRGDLPDIHNRILMSIERAEREAFDSEMVVFDPEQHRFHRTRKPDLRTLHAFLKLQCEVHGLLASAKTTLNPTEVGVPVAELAELLDGLGFEVRKKEDKDDGSSDEADA